MRSQRVRRLLLEPKERRESGEDKREVAKREVQAQVFSRKGARRDYLRLVLVQF
jgi:hypothetical protein